MVRSLSRHAAFFGAGLIATAAQVLLLRDLIVDVAGDETSIGVGLSSWLLGIALGAWAARRRGAGGAPCDAAVGLALLAASPVVALGAGRLLRGALSLDPGELPGLGPTLLLSAATLLGPGAFVGWTFTAFAAAASRVWSAGEGIARLYVSESAGSLAGGLLVTLLVGTRLPPLPAAAAFGALAAALGLVAMGRGPALCRVAVATALASSLALLLASGPLQAWTEGSRFAAVAPNVPLRGVIDTPYQHLAVGGDEVFHVYSSGQFVSSFPDPWGDEERTHLLASLVSRPARVLTLGGGFERGPLRVLLRHPVDEVVVVEPDRRAFSFLRARLPAEDRAALDDPRVRVVHDDPRRLVSGSGEPFDLILLLGPDPVTLLRSRLSTVEFFRACALRLAPRGALVVSVRTAPLVLTGETAAVAGALVRTLSLVFPVVRATPGPDALLLAGHDEAAVTVLPAVIAARWAERGLLSPSFSAALVPVLLAPDRVRAHDLALRAAAESAEASRDDRPVSFLHAVVRRQEAATGRGGRAVAAVARLSPPVLVALAFLPSTLALARLLLARGLAGRRAGAAASHAVTVMGAAGMGWSLLALLSFQTHAGALYGQLGALTALFMLGLAVGALLARRSLALAPGASAEETGGEPTAGRHALLASLVAALVYAVALPWTMAAAAGAARGGALFALGAHGALLLAAGVVTGAVFPAAAAVRLAGGEGAGEAAGRLETADHVGAAVAALLGAVLFVPILGLAHTARVIAALVALALAAVGCTPRR